MTSEQELATEFGVSRMTIRQALDHLVREGRMLRVQGKGTFVAEGRKLEPLSALTSFSENMRALGREPSYRILGVVEVPAPPEVAAHLALEPNALALRIVRLLIADEVPMALMRGYLPPWIYTAQPALFSPERLDQVSLYRTLEVELGIQLWKARETVEALTAGDDAERLELNPDDLLLVVHRHTLDIEARPVEYTQLRYRADLYRYQVELFRQGFAAPAASRFA
jgi:GntR family transcriptional regulator